MQNLKPNWNVNTYLFQHHRNSYLSATQKECTISCIEVQTRFKKTQYQHTEGNRESLSHQPGQFHLPFSWTNHIVQLLTSDLDNSSNRVHKAHLEPISSGLEKSKAFFFNTTEKQEAQLSTKIRSMMKPYTTATVLVFLNKTYVAHAKSSFKESPISDDMTKTCSPSSGRVLSSASEP